MRRLVLMLVLGMAVMPAAAQLSSFEVVSIKPASNSGFPVSALNTTGGRLVAKNATVKSLVGFAYGNAQKPLSVLYQIVGGPAWIDNEKYDVQAKLPEDGGPIPEDQVRRMVQSLLEDRFKLQMHWEKRETPVYNLVIAKDGLKMKLSEDQTPPVEVQGPIVGPLDASGKQARGTYRVVLSPSGPIDSWRAEPTSAFVIPLQSLADRLVIDKTGLDGLFDAELRSADNALSPAAGGDAASRRATRLSLMEEQLGLRLESSKGQVEVLVIDSVQRPSEN